MDIVNLDGLSQRKKRRRFRSRERRHTTDVRSSLREGQNLYRENSQSEEHLSNVGIDSTPMKSTFHANSSTGTSMSLSSSWNSLFDVGDFESPPDSDYLYFEGSQATSFQPMVKYDDPKHHYQLSYELALDNLLTPFVGVQPEVDSQKVLELKQRTSHMQHVIHELRMTEEVYIEDLSQVVDGYQVPLESRVGVLPILDSDLRDLFGNISEIVTFHRSLLDSLKSSGNDPQKIANCFLACADGFKIYTSYCNNYPRSVSILSRLSQDHDISIFLKRCQERLNHMLPLGAYLLKPVQRVLKYSLLLMEMLKSVNSTELCYISLNDAIREMTAVAAHINSMKRKYDAAVHIQEIQSLIRGNQGLDLTNYGDLVQEENFRYSGGKSTGSTFRGRTERYVFLFQRLFLITKREEDGYLYKSHLEMRDLQLTERVEKDLNCFQIRQVSTGRSFAFQARSLEQKQHWVHLIKVQLMDSLPELPSKAKEMILRGFPSNSEPASPSFALKKGTSESSVQPSIESSSKVSSWKKKRQQSNRTAIKLAQATLTGLLSSSVHQENDDSASSDGESSGVFDNQVGPVAYKEVSPKQPTTPNKHSSEAGLSVKSRSSPPLSHKSDHHYSLNVANQGIANDWKEGTPESNPSVEFEIVSTNFTSAQPDVEIEIEQNEHTRESADELLFDELMRSDSVPPAVTDSLLYFSTKEPDTNTTPTDYYSCTTNEETIRETTSTTARGTVPVSFSSTHPSAVNITSSDSESQITPQASPMVKRANAESFTIDSSVMNKDSSRTKSSLHRHHSFQNGSQRVGTIHRKQDSLSTDNTPLSSPRIRTRSKNRILQSISLSSFKQSPTTVARKANFSTDGPFYDESPHPFTVEHSSEQLSPILPPPKEFAQSPISRDSTFSSSSSLSESHSKYTTSSSPDSFSYSPSDSDAKSSRWSSYDLNPDEVVSIDEVLSNFNHYADTTGEQSMKPQHFQSPQPAKKSKKKRLRNRTVATTDFRTIEQVTQNFGGTVPSSTQRKSSSKVKTLAREYSQRIRDKERTRHSKETEEPQFFKDNEGNKKEPDWLQKLKEQKKTKETPMAWSDDESELKPPEPYLESSSAAVRRGRLRGWVQSLVDKFSTSK